MTLSRQTFENCTVVASALVAEIRQTRPAQTRVPRPGRAGSTPAERTFVVSTVRDPSGSRAGFRLRPQGWACRFAPLRTYMLSGPLVKSGITLGFYP